MSKNSKAYYVNMGSAKCSVDLGVGSERGSYVNQIIFYTGLADRIER